MSSGALMASRRKASQQARRSLSTRSALMTYAIVHFHRDVYCLSALFGPTIAPAEGPVLGAPQQPSEHSLSATNPLAYTETTDMCDRSIASEMAQRGKLEAEEHPGARLSLWNAAPIASIHRARGTKPV